MLRLLPFLVLLLATGCEDTSGLPLLPTDEIEAGFRRGGVADTIEVNATNALPLREAVLIDGQGKETPAQSIDVNAAPSTATSQQLGNDPYQGDVFGAANIGPGGLPIIPGAAPRGYGRLLLTVSTAVIPLPDAVEYGRSWRDYRIRLRFGAGSAGAGDVREIAAPAPPA
jgi:hypothetical protein